ncbi:MAG: bifunctional diguanylate cyclase/phosphodiesterase [Curvibacter sp.]|nr:bifunctional diguanylate cyclase/phosphodiesterase [Curvibacter sp.]
MTRPAPPLDLEVVRLHAIDRLAALMESQTRSRAFASNLSGLVRQVLSELLSQLRALAVHSEPQDLLGAIEPMIATCERLETTLSMLLVERQRQWQRNGAHAQETMLDFNRTLLELSKTLIEKDLFERQSKVLERIILSHEHVAQWKAFVQEILADFHAIFPFNFFYIAFAEEHGLSMYLYYLGEYSQATRAEARSALTRKMLTALDLPPDVLLEFEEFSIPVPRPPKQLDDIRMITVAVPEHTPKLAGLLGVAYVGSDELTPQEESVVRSILSVMVMVVGSSKLLSRTLAELEYYAMHDPLTGLYNRRQFNNVLEYEFGRSERHGHEFALLMLDLDDFKDINDTYGHQVGDEALRGVAEILRQHTRKGDIAARLGGDEFAVLLMETGLSGALAAAQQLGRILRERGFQSDSGKTFHLTVSIGVATYPKDARNEVDIMAGADTAMYRAKGLGKDATCAMDTEGPAPAQSRISRDYAERLREALQQNRIVPYFHSIVDCHSGAVFAYETLARMVEPSGEVVAASQFIETIEKYGMARDLDRIIIRAALQALRQRLGGGTVPPRLFLNLSAQEIQGRGILQYAEETCAELGVPPQSVVFEILERDAIGDMANMRRFLASLREKGFAFALDDFGSGYNSFHYLRELKFDYVKIDGAFVRNILSSKVDHALVRNLSRLCQDIGILTVAEYVENADILQALREMGVNYVQGFHIGLPTQSIPAT